MLVNGLRVVQDRDMTDEVLQDEAYQAALKGPEMNTMRPSNFDHPRHLKIRVDTPVNYDHTTVLICRYEPQEDGTYKQYYARDFVWQEYSGFQVLDTTDIAFPDYSTIDIKDRT